MRISRLFIKHHSESQLLCCPAECRDTDVALSVRNGVKKKVYEMPKGKKRLQKQRWSWHPAEACPPSASKLPWLKYLWKTSSERKRRQLWKKASLFMSPSSSPPLHHHHPPPLLSSPRCCYSECTMPANTSSPWNHEMLPFCISYRPASPCNPLLHSPLLLYKKKQTRLWDGEVVWLLEQKPEHEEEDVGCALSLIKV